ncbi:MAG: PSD1 and planctomycete cytochrome C domain-containing protein [Gemmataceae bacterium]|nr:PSD1 and planctomycete cytochrome C domain-containing protein [Gemmataceae bacterium]MDW8266506.1 PSD1 and planctomycete cytochrome C domain-containing protein [Gemmataceae bacterium]
MMLPSLVTFLAALPSADGTTEIQFNRDIRPILSENCFACHGFDAKQRKAGLRLDVPEGAYADRNGSAAIKPGDLKGSALWQRITSSDPDTLMPPPASRKRLTAEQKETIRRWIEQGARYQKHWAFEPPVKPAEPAVRHTSWPRNAIDRFILARLEKEGLSPQPEADRPTLIRRVAFTLTGLPPTVAEVDAFLADTAPDAYERLVDRYLQSPRYGEEMARHWLDVARYADTHGLHLDNERSMWAYRDWVIKAFNDNLSFDRFTLWQLAGDLLPNPTLEQLTATGFNRCNVTTSEGGSIPAEFTYRYAVDRTSTVIQTWMGLTGGCAVCHDHKYDPLTMKEFYSLYAFFYSAADPAMDGNVHNTAPFVQLLTPEQQAALDELRRRESQVRQRLEHAVRDLDYLDPAELPPEQEDVSETVFDDSFPLGVTVRNTLRNPPDWIVDPDFGAPSGRRVLRQAASRFFETVIQCQLMPLTVPEGGRFEVWLRIDPKDVPQAVVIDLNAGGKRRIGWGEEGSLDGSIPQMAAARRRGPLPPAGAWTRLEFTAEEMGLQPGQRVESISLQHTGGVVYWDSFHLHGTSTTATDPRASFRAWWRLSTGRPIFPDLPGELQGVLRQGPDKPTKPELWLKLREYYLAYLARPTDAEFSALRRTWDEARAARLAIEEGAAGTMIFRELDQPRQAFVMLRGQYDKPGEKVEPDVPAIFPPLRKEKPNGRATRLDLARWLLADDHPLTTRVTVNRFWQQVFGTGLVKTSYDFGSQGEPPSHPELLDWLAVHFRESGWDVKALMRLLVTSATFRQQARLTPELRFRDPENRLLARGPRIRLDAEQIRDNALFVSGLLQLQMGGKGVKPYQPPNIWEPVGYADSNTRFYLQDHGDALYRRSIYCFLKRTAPPPFMSNFDAPNREQFCTKRERSNTPMQALQLLNDVQHFEAARALAERALAEGGQTPEQRIEFLYRTVLARRPDAEEQRLVRQFLATQQKYYEANLEAARRVITVGESAPRNVAPVSETAAWTLVANLILNLDETINRN